MIKIDKVSKVFDSRGIAGLHEVNLVIPSNHIFALMGPNGSGKSTLLNIIAGELHTDTGKIEASGKITKLKIETPDSNLNVQKFLISQITITDDEDKKIQLSRDMAMIFEFTFQLKQKIGELSQGQLQKVLMSANLINNPEILLLDEPFIHLDPMMRKDILRSLFEYIRQKEMTVIWVTHEKDEAFEFADTIALIQHGKIEQVSDAFNMLQHPKNIFVARFFGNENLIQIKKENNKWITRWGEIPLHFDALEAYLVVPASAWIDSDKEEDQFLIEEVFIQFHYTYTKLIRDGKSYIAHLPLHQFPKLKILKMISLRPDLKQCSLMNL